MEVAGGDFNWLAAIAAAVAFASLAWNVWNAVQARRPRVSVSGVPRGPKISTEGASVRIRVANSGTTVETVVAIGLGDPVGPVDRRRRERSSREAKKQKPARPDLEQTEGEDRHLTVLGRIAVAAMRERIDFPQSLGRWSVSPVIHSPTYRSAWPLPPGGLAEARVPLSDARDDDHPHRMAPVEGMVQPYAVLARGVVRYGEPFCASDFSSLEPPTPTSRRGLGA